MSDNFSSEDGYGNDSYDSDSESGIFSDDFDFDDVEFDNFAVDDKDGEENFDDTHTTTEDLVNTYAHLNQKEIFGENSANNITNSSENVDYQANQSHKSNKSRTLITMQDSSTSVISPGSASNTQLHNPGTQVYIDIPRKDNMVRNSIFHRVFFSFLALLNMMLSVVLLSEFEIVLPNNFSVFTENWQSYIPLILATFSILNISIMFWNERAVASEKNDFFSVVIGVLLIIIVLLFPTEFTTITLSVAIFFGVYPVLTVGLVVNLFTILIAMLFPFRASVLGNMDLTPLTAYFLLISFLLKIFGYEIGLYLFVTFAISSIEVIRIVNMRGDKGILGEIASMLIFYITTNIVMASIMMSYGFSRAYYVLASAILLGLTWGLRYFISHLIFSVLKLFFKDEHLIFRYKPRKETEVHIIDIYAPTLLVLLAYSSI